MAASWSEVQISELSMPPLIQMMIETISLICPYCGEGVELEIDPSGGSRQSYVEDCPVCCQPWDVEVTGDQDGTWNAILQRGNE